MSGIDGALHLVAKLKGFEEARKAAYYMEYDKWHPREGLLLTVDNPYQHFLNQDHLNAYVGKYKTDEDEEWTIEKNEREGAVFARVRGQIFPLFDRGEERLLHIDGALLEFEKDANQQVVSFRIKEKDQLFIKELT